MMQLLHSKSQIKKMFLIDFLKHQGSLKPWGCSTVQGHDGRKQLHQTFRETFSEL